MISYILYIIFFQKLIGGGEQLLAPLIFVTRFNTLYIEMPEMIRILYTE